MTRHSQNGWPVVGKSDCDQGPFQGVKFPNGILAGDVAKLARWQLQRYAATVEPLKSGTCWGWYDKLIEGSSTISNHASATAWDVNADAHPMGTPASRTMSPAKIAACRAIVKASRGTLRWGGDYSGRPDPMHWEVDASPAEVHAFVKTLGAKLSYSPLGPDAGWPHISQGMSDADHPDDYGHIRKMQHVIGAAADGEWGDETTTKLAAYCGIAKSAAKTMTEAIYRKVHGISTKVS